MSKERKYKFGIMVRFFLSIFFIGFAITFAVQGIISQLSNLLVIAFGLYLAAVVLIITSYFIYKQAAHLLRLLGPN